MSVSFSKMYYTLFIHSKQPHKKLFTEFISWNNLKVRFKRYFLRKKNVMEMITTFVKKKNQFKLPKIESVIKHCAETDQILVTCANQFVLYALLLL